MKHALAFRHLCFEDLGSLEQLLPSMGFRYRYADIPVLTPAGLRDLDVLSPELLVVLGGPMSVNNRREFPWLEQELELVRTRLENKLPVLGICLGAQIMAAALGSSIYPAPEKEIGWSALQLSPEGEQAGLSLFGDAAGAQVLHWHGETFDLPPGARLLASTGITRNQAFALDNWGLGLQFHLEACYPKLESWFAGHVGELQALNGMDIARLRAESQKKAPVLETGASEFFAAWIESL